ncbi:MAG: lipopolysaccharide biosynthesis protein [Suipraeoptans sp.]
MEKKKSIISHFATLASGTIITMIIGVLTTPIITRLVDPEQYGQLSIFNLYLSMAVLVLCLGLDQSLVRYYYKNDSIGYKSSLLRKCCFIPIGISVLLCIVFFLLCWKNIIKFEFDIIITFFLCICIVLDLFSRFASLLVRLQYDSKTYSFIKIARKLSYVALAIPAVYLFQGCHLLALVICVLISIIVEVLIGVIRERKIWMNFDKEDSLDLRSLVKYGLPFIVSMGLSTVFQSIDKISLNQYGTYVDVGIYSSAMSLINVFAILQSTINTLWTPMAVEHYEQKPDDREFYARANTYVTILMFFVGLCLILVKDVFALLLGEKYRLAAYIIPCLAFHPIMYTISETTVNGIVFAKKSSYHIVVGLLSCVVNIVGNTILVPIYGCKGAAISTGISYIVFFAVRTFLSVKCYKVDYGIGKIAVLTCIVFAYALYNTFVKFNVLSVVGYCICSLTMFMMYKKDILCGLSEIIEFVKNKLSKNGER